AEFRLAQGLKANVMSKRSAYALAAGKLSPNRLSALLDRDRRLLERFERDLPRALRHVADRKREVLKASAARLSVSGIERQQRQGGEQIRLLASRLTRAVDLRLSEARTALDQKGRLLKSLSYEAVLERGFALVRDENDHPVKRAGQVKKGAKLTIEFAGRERIGAIATDAPTPAAPKPAPARKPSQQGDLF
ncbi:MAG: exodeoxyribonuclease VII large subunit, partial [Oricola sp.]